MSEFLYATLAAVLLPSLSIIVWELFLSAVSS